MKPLTRVLIVAALSLSSSALADTPPAGAPAKTPAPNTGNTGNTGKPEKPEKAEKLADSDLQIIARYHDDDATEIDLGKLAAQRSPRQAVKDYGGMLARDHAAFDAKLTAMVKQAGQTIPKAQQDTQAERDALASTQQRVTELKKLRGAAFENEYLRLMIELHARAVAGVDAHAAAAKRPEIAQLLRDEKPALQMHLDRARELQARTQSSK